MRSVPIVLVGKEFWEPMVEWIKTTMLNDGKISPEDLNLFTLVDTAEEAMTHLLDKLNENSTNF
jgi:predicted Rossmann-fold nucleotide-binding protein